jgi:hypothetical protein
MTARSERLAAAQIFGRFVLLNFQMIARAACRKIQLSPARRRERYQRCL